jgi:UPF0755 protein
MIDELDLGFDDYERGRSRHRRGRRGKAARGKRKGRSFAALFMAFVLLAVLGIGGFLGFTFIKGYLAAKDYPGAGTGTVTVQIMPGDTLTDMANTLFHAQVVESGRAFVDAAGANPKAKSIEVGYYALHRHMKARLALDMLLARKADNTLANKVSTRVTIPEGTISIDVYSALSKATKIPVAKFQAAAKDPVALGVPSWWYKRTDGKPALKPPSLEGFLYPATYDFNPGATATEILHTMVLKFIDVTTTLGFVDTVQNSLHITPYEALVAASIAQVEARFAADMPGVARVLYNRAFTTFPCNCLQLDSEVNYWLRISGQEARDSGSLKLSQLHDAKDPYNTHDKPGLPVGPISNPGQDALKGAMTAPKNNFFFFLAVDKAGHTAFATTLTQFCQKVNQAIANGVSLTRCS